MIINVEMWNNHIRQVKDFTLSSESVKCEIGRFDYNGEGRVKDPKVENSQLPPIALSFYGYIYENDSVPSPQQLLTVYL